MILDQTEITEWAMRSGWRDIGGMPSLIKPKSPKEAIARLVFKVTVVQFEVKKPSGTWEKIGSAAYADVKADEETGLPCGLGMEKMPGLNKLMQDNKDQKVFASFG
ncbi:MAG: hypothetical protein JWO24_3025 [Rhodospirillales bacterium]|jgi:hypothetical protein|nr:hypothetical protein [Rhodospirillales bacterium]